jgi:hypothetical protein
MDLERERAMAYSFYEATLILIPKLYMDTTTTKELQASLFNEHRCKNPQNNGKPNSTTSERS